MPQRKKLGTGVVFPNSYKKTENHPDFNGRLEFTCPDCGKVHYLDAGFWKKTTSKGTPMMTTSITAMPEEQAAEQAKRSAERQQQPQEPEPEPEPDDPFGGY